SVRRGLVIRDDQSVGRDPEAPESVLHEPLFTVRHRAYELTDSAIRSKNDLRAGTELERRSAAHLVETVCGQPLRGIV
ncbi:MAG TPA: hypothetical protein VKE23_12580, partial [Candidatus Limnocylindria bacterium]|nr:hypothetical protein [Candidatus Limnocylindria bacterium]